MRTLRLAAAWLLSCAVGAAGAATAVYRCGNVYADTPCPHATVVDVDDTRSAADQAAARGVALRESALASSMAADRLRNEPRQIAIRPVLARPPVPVKAPKKRSNRRWRTEDEDGNFVALIPARRAKKP